MTMTNQPKSAADNDESAIDLSRKKVIYNIAKVRDAMRVIDEFNKLDLREVLLYENGKTIQASDACLEAWRFIGLSNKEFVEMEFWNRRDTDELADTDMGGCPCGSKIVYRHSDYQDSRLKRVTYECHGCTKVLQVVEVE